MGSSENAKLPYESHNDPARKIGERNAEMPRTTAYSIGDRRATLTRVDPHDSRRILEPHCLKMGSEKVRPFT